MSYCVFELIFPVSVISALEENNFATRLANRIQKLYLWITPLLLWSRVYLYYHSFEQIVAGSFVGSFCAVILFLAVKTTTLDKKSLK
jgi:membrane-associated phospholipid phosphatase